VKKVETFCVTTDIYIDLTKTVPSWRLIECYTKKCRSRINLTDGQIINDSEKEHNHIPN